MNKNMLIMLAVSASLVACNARDLPVGDVSYFSNNGVFIQGRTYISEPIRSCLKFSRCDFRMSLMPDGQGVITSLERENRVTYNIQNGRITTTLVGDGDIPATLEFDIETAAMSLVRRDDKNIFRLHATLVEVFKPTGARQCEDNSGTSLMASQTTLNSAGIETPASACGKIQGIVFPAVCGGGTSGVNIHAIGDDEQTLLAAKNLGYEKLTKSINPIEKITCP